MWSLPFVPLLLLFAVLVLLLAALVRALRCGAAPKPAPAPPPAASPENEAAYAAHLARMLQCATTNQPGEDPARVKAAFAEMDRVMEQLYPLVHKNTEIIQFNQAKMLRWPGADNTRPAIALMAHTDVVPAEGAWRHPPFGGAVAEGRVWGRGAIDDKGALCAIFEAAESLMAESFTPPCDVYLLTSYNEEVMGDGAPQMRDYLAQKGVRLAILCDEGGAVGPRPLPCVSGTYALAGVVEKGVANLRFTARSAGGHASTPPKNSPLARLAAFVRHVETRPPFKRRLSPTARAFLRATAPGMPLAQRFLVCNPWLFGPFYPRLLARLGPRMDAMLRTTCAFTMASGSEAPNVLPETASVTANIRPIHHQPLSESLAALTALAKRYHLEAEVVYQFDCTAGVDMAGEGYRYMRRCIEKTFPEATVAPFPILFGTDARHFAETCPCTLRFSPYLQTPGEPGAMHGLDESLSTAALARAVMFYRNLLLLNNPPWRGPQGGR